LVEVLGHVRLVVGGGGAGVAGDRGLDPAGVDAGDGDRVAGDRELHPQRLGEAADPELRRVVRGLPRHPQQPEQARDVHDVPVAGLDEVGQELLGALHHAPEVDVHDPLEVVVADLGEVTVQGDAGVVDHRVDPAELLAHGRGVGAHRGPVPDVELVGAHPLAGAAGPQGDLLDRGGGLHQTGLVPVAERQHGPGLRGLQRELAADPGAGPGDHHDLAVQRPHAGTFSVSVSTVVVRW
jgi:hypothetical protein